MNATDLISRFGQEATTYRIPTSDKPEEDVIVRHVNDVREIMKINEKAKSLIRVSMKGSCPPGWKKYLPITQEVAQIVAEVVLLVEFPKFDDLEALQLCQEAGAFASWLHLEIMKRYSLSIPAAEEERIDDLKNDSVTMVSGGPSSPSEETFSESIPASSNGANGRTRGSSSRSASLK